MASEKNNCVRYRNETCSVADGCTNETAGDCKQRLTAELAIARAEIERLREALLLANATLIAAASDIYQTARTNQGNIDGRDPTFPDDEPILSLIGTHFVHQDGVNESMRVWHSIKNALRATVAGAYRDGHRDGHIDDGPDEALGKSDAKDTLGAGEVE